jgi:hypothetical protein
MHIITKKVSKVPTREEKIEKAIEVAKDVVPVVSQIAVQMAPKGSRRDVKSVAAIVLSILAIAGQILQAWN